ncbi:MAG: CapA family protein, partial [Dehalococcoidia bacterium]|nr:CapA family protein [Dehalococcoidia bacterium]
AGIDEMIARLQAVGVSVTGANTIVTKTVRGMTFAFLGFNGVGQPFDRDALRARIASARQSADVVVVQFHWGREEVLFPQPFGGVAPDDPREIGRLAIDAGADLVIGNHPHWVQGVEIYRDKLITYAHGNFLFDQHFSLETRESVIGRYVFYGNRLVAARFFPARIDDYTQPRPLSGADADAVLARMRESTRLMLARPFATPVGAGSPVAASVTPSSRPPTAPR